MEEYFKFKNDIENYESQKVQITAEYEEDIQQLNKKLECKKKDYEFWADLTFTKNIRDEIVRKAEEKGIPKATIDELKNRSDAWEKGERTIEDIDLFANFKIELIEKPSYIGKKKNILFSKFFGGKKR